ncbi:hypothetical protein LCGC14_0881440 [marine sediment metagenome]|uniref:Disease resistance R13L4/SHOC-2-like LRR domain-containing protein n=1 Tax=marine sediment metagenome TaxID=412755 RepID=A0A0F9P6S7_9ZZZZ
MKIPRIMSETNLRAPLKFRVNDSLELRLEEGKTNIYVDGELFEQCKFLLINIPLEKAANFEEIDSIDEASEKLSKSLEPHPFKESKTKIPPETEFWGHCSNLQVWHEHNYDSKLIHSNLAFPLLKKLTELGDPLAKRVFKEEIAKRLESGYWPVMEYLIEEKYTEYLTREEFLYSVLGNDEQSQKEVSFILELEKFPTIGFHLEKEVSPEYNNFVVRNWHIEELSIDVIEDLNEILPFIGDLKFLKKLHFRSGNLTNFPESVGHLFQLEALDLACNKLHSLPKTLKNLKLLRLLDLGENNFTEFPNVIQEITSLEELDLGNNKLEKIPEDIGYLINLRKLLLNNNHLKRLPDSIGQLKSLKYLDLFYNIELKFLPKTFCKLQSLTELTFSYNTSKYFPEIICELTSLEILSLSNTKLKTLPNSILKLNKLKELYLKKI